MIDSERAQQPQPTPPASESAENHVTRTSTATIAMSSRTAQPPRDLGAQLVAAWSQVERSHGPVAREARIMTPSPSVQSSSTPYQLLTPGAAANKELKDAFFRDPSPTPSRLSARTPTSPSVLTGGTPPTHRFAGVERLVSRQRIYDQSTGLLAQTFAPQLSPAVAVTAAENESDVSGHACRASRPTSP